MGAAEGRRRACGGHRDRQQTATTGHSGTRGYPGACAGSAADAAHANRSHQRPAWPAGCRQHRSSLSHRNRRRAAGTEASDTGSLALYRRLLGHVLPYRGIFAISVVAMAIAAAMDAAFAALIKEITDRGLVAPDMEFIRLIPWLIAGVILVRAISGFAGNYCMAWVGVTFFW